MVFSQSEMLQKEVYLVECIDGESLGTFKHLSGVFFVRPTANNFLRLAKELKTPRFKDYHLFFSNKAPQPQLLRLAKCDEYEVVRQVHEYFADVCPVNSNLFSLNVPTTVGLTLDPGLWTPYEDAVFTRVVDGVYSSCLLMKVNPIVRFQRISRICARIASQVKSRLDTESHNLTVGDPSIKPFDKPSSRGSSQPLLLILDRREDPVTPLLNQWTYQGMVHELIGINGNKVDLSKAPGTRKEADNIVLLESYRDPFFEEHQVSNFGDLAVAVNNRVKEYQIQVANNQRIETIDEMQQFVDSFDSYRDLSSSVSKHVAVIHELSRVVDTHNLLKLSSLEQDIACSDNNAEHFKNVLEVLHDASTVPMEKLRICLLYALRYESDTRLVDLKSELRHAGIPPVQVQLIDTILAYAGTKSRSLDLFENKNFLSIAKRVVQRGIRGVENVYTRHRSLLGSTLESLLKGKLNRMQFPLVEGDPLTYVQREPIPSQSPNAVVQKPSEVIVFIIGGVTFEEARDASSISKQLGCRVLLGGSTVHNSSSFLADLAQLTKPKQTTDHRLARMDFNTGQSTGVFSRVYR